jgi:hypothetical protein
VIPRVFISERTRAASGVSSFPEGQSIGIAQPPGRWRTLLTFTVVMVALLGSAFATAFLVYQQNASGGCGNNCSIFCKRPNWMSRTAIAASSMFSRKTPICWPRGNRRAHCRYVLPLALSHGDTFALEHAAEVVSVRNTL